MVQFYGNPNFERSLDNCFTSFGLEKKNAWTQVRPGIWRDEFGVEWNRSVDKDIGVVCNCLVTPKNLQDYQFPDPEDPSRYEDYQTLPGNPTAQYFVAGLGFSLFERAWTLAGMENVLMAMVLDKEFAHALLDRILDFNLKLISNACKTPVDAISFGDDWGQQTGLLMGPDLWREFIKPRIRQMYSLIKKSGKRVFIHSCGKVDSIFPDLIECGLDVFNPFQPEVMDVFRVKRDFGNDLCFYGGISTQKTLPYGTVQQVKDEVKRLLDAVGKNGGYFAAPAHGIPGDAKPENIHAMIEVLQTQR